MRTLKTLITAVLLVFSLNACSSTKTYRTYTLNPSKTMVLVKSFLCEDVMNDDYVLLEDYVAQPPVLCDFTTLELSADSDSAQVHVVYHEPHWFDLDLGDGTEVQILEDSVSELTVNANLDMPQSFTKGEAETLTLTVNGSRIYDKGNRNLSTGVYADLVFRPMTVIENVYKSTYSDPFTSVDKDFDALADPWDLKPENDEPFSTFTGQMSLTIPDTVNSQTVCLIERLALSHFQFIIFLYYEGQP
jgi:uncharacterized protein YcfL